MLSCDKRVSNGCGRFAEKLVGGRTKHVGVKSLVAASATLAGLTDTQMGEGRPESTRVTL